MRNEILAGCLAALVAPASASNRAELAGTFYYVPSSLEGEQICFYPAPRDQQPVLHMIGMTEEQYGHEVWFCFKNTSAAANLLGIPLKLPSNICGWRGQARVSISDYTVNVEQNDASDLARLESVIAVHKRQPITQCDEE
ncbi:hypothetical protein HKW97_24350 (plasmid) [Pseudomonas luteola]|uniref:hypothetical protein n=1 Tax=Pseudomonas luteola TaxID=47886 RepID=UPI0038900EFB